MNDELYFKDAFTEVDGDINFDGNNINVNCITSKNNKFSLDSDGNLVVNSITTSTSNNNNIDFDSMYPVGSIYFSLMDINPSTLFGGVWEQIAKGRTLVGVDTSQTEFNTVKKEGGSKYLQKHAHKVRYTCGNANGVHGGMPGTSVNANPNYNELLLASEGEGNSGNLQPYLTCYIWTRVS